MIPDTQLAYVLIRSAIFALQSITPLSFSYCAVTLYALLSPHSLARQLLGALPVWVLVIVTIFCLNEVWFFFYARRKVQRHQALSTAAPKLSPRQRESEFKRAIESIHDPRAFLEGWFKGASVNEIGYDNVMQWTLWAFFDLPADADTLHDLPEDTQQEAKRYTDAWSTKFGITFRPGFNHNIQSIRLSLDPVRTVHRPACVYLGVGVLYDHLAWSRYRALGFRHYVPDANSGHRVSYPYIGLPSLPSHSTLTYWYKPCAPLRSGEKEDLPIVFVHGIGAGLKVYRTMVTEICKRNPRSAIYLLEIPCVAMKLVEKLPVRDQLVRDVEAMLQARGHSEALFIGHSLGTVVVSWILHCAPRLCRKVMLIDPVVWLLHYPDVAYNFLHRPPSNANQWLYHFFVCSEPGIARFLGRGFVWHENVLWLEDVPSHCEMRVYLAENDMIVNIPKVFEYLTETTTLESLKRGERSTGDEMILRHPTKPNVETHLWLGPDMDHAVFLLKQKTTNHIIAACGEMATS
jgi:pimeloyl-ACP methyl ester carboxylesterase